MRGEDQAVRRMIDAYQGIQARVKPQLDKALADISREISAGRKPTPAQLFQTKRMQAVVAQLDVELNRVAECAGQIIVERQRELADLAQEHARELAKLGLPPGVRGPIWSHLPAESLTDLTGALSEGSPLSHVLAQIAPDGVGRLKQAIIEGVGAGLSPEQIAREANAALGSSMGRVATVVRTEDMRAYRSSSNRAFQANDDVIDGWIWFASLSFDTCASCLALHGTKHPLSQSMDTHPNCRCVQVPSTKSWHELGFKGPDQRPQIESGADWLARQDEATQRRALGPAKFEAYRKGDIALHDLAAHSKSPAWGGMHHEASLKSALAAAKARQQS